MSRPALSGGSPAVRALLDSALGRAGLSHASPRFSGLVAPARSLAVADAARRLAKGVVLLVVPGDADLDAAVGDIRFFLAALEGHGEAAVERLVLPYPSTEVDPYRGFAPHLRVASARARALHALAAGAARVVVASAAAVLPRVPEPAQLLLASFEVKPGVEVDLARLTETLAAAGYTPADPVDAHGEFCRRGGILDVFAAADELPVRIEFVGDSVESIRRFDPGTQRSVETLDRFGIVPVREGEVESGAQASDLFQYLRVRAAQVWLSEPDEVRTRIEAAWTQVASSFADREARDARPRRTPAELLLSPDEAARELSGAVVMEELPLGEPSDGPAQTVSTEPAPVYHGRVQDWVHDLRAAQARGDRVLFVAGSHGRAERTVELLRDYEVRAAMASEAGDGAGVVVAEGLLSRGFRLRARGDAAAPALQVYAETDVFDEERRRTTGGRRRSHAAAFLSDLRDLKVGDYIVHVDHGIGRFVGLKQLAVARTDAVQEFVELRYHGEAKLFVPVERLDLIQKYSGAAAPALDRLGGTSWDKAKTRVKKAMRDMAEELLKLYAARKAVPGHAFSPDTHWQEEFEDAFEYVLTPDQETAIADIKRDMEAPTPMDRLLCGDVGYGKTEVAMRAAFKAVMDGKQVAFLAPTTVLAAQHLKTLRERFAAFPARIDMVSRFRAKAEIAATLEALASGRLDIIVGTHRLLSKDARFHDLGLLVVDEEQRFGVAHKERIKRLRKSVDVLTMTATPIPRTLNMSLVGIRDMSVIETPPKDRLAIQTTVAKFDAGVIARAIRHEVDRGGQVFFVHNRVESIYSMGHLLQRLVPDIRVVVGHGQLAEDALERAMLDFMAHKYDVLLATTIVENGLDIPNANTMIVNRADRYGLSQLYQLRGRVGRSDRAAYAYLLVPPEETLSPVARKRLAAIREFSDLGSGFRVAALDLEIRGAGNLLGGEQSGQIDAVGFEMYMKLLEETVRELKGEDLEDRARASVSLKVDVRLGEAFVPDTNQRLMLYRRLAGARDEAEIGRIVDEARDRYGAPPAPLLNLADLAHLRVMADGLGIESLDREGPLVAVKFRERTSVDPRRLVALVQERGDLQLLPPATVRMDLRLESRAAPRQPSWWTARATAGEVAPGFTKADILRAAPEDPRAPGGVLEKVRGLLEDLGV